MLIKSNVGEIVKPDQFKAINDVGMPMYQRPFMKGKLYVQFSIEVPKSGSLSLDQCKALEAILAPRPSNGMTDMELDECEETILQDVNMEGLSKVLEFLHNIREGFIDMLNMLWMSKEGNLEVLKQPHIRLLTKILEIANSHSQEVLLGK